jgi:hypothetical protein
MKSGSLVFVQAFFVEYCLILDILSMQLKLFYLSCKKIHIVLSLQKNIFETSHEKIFTHRGMFILESSIFNI